MAFQNKALNDYNRNSNWQYQIATRFIPALTEILNELDSSGLASICFVDYGSSEGYNSMSILQSALATFRLHSSTPIEVIHTDLPENNWTALFTTINNSSNSYKHLSNISYSAIGQSFYEQLVPSNSVNLGYSNYAFHYLSQVPMRHGRPRLFYREAELQLISDMTLNLSHRINELASGGFFMFSATSKSDDGKQLEDLVFKVLEISVLKGIISESDFMNFFWPTYPLDEIDILKILKNFNALIEVRLFEFGKYLCPYYSELKNGGNIEEYRYKLSRMIGSILKNALFRALNLKENEKEAVFERVLQELSEIINDEELYSSYYSIIIQKL